ncbi:CoA-binding protein [bacterium]|nr:CoA-binding protein [bacterium]MBU1982983.1 CoA-binding protein [bacterium]
MKQVPSTAAARIEDFLAQRRIAVVGVSRDEKGFARVMFRDFLSYGYDVVPVNPNAVTVEDRPCYPNVAAISPPVDGVFVLTAPSIAGQIVTECLSTGVPRVWVHFASGSKKLDPELIERCEKGGVSLIRGFCPYMFIRQTNWFHRLHGWFARRSPAYRAGK